LYDHISLSEGGKGLIREKSTTPSWLQEIRDFWQQIHQQERPRASQEEPPIWRQLPESYVVAELFLEAESVK
jgi:hypothetical protein